MFPMGSSYFQFDISHLDRSPYSQVIPLPPFVLALFLPHPPRR
jgi:hypothetical protein